jgi:hypothetical protein
VFCVVRDEGLKWNKEHPLSQLSEVERVQLKEISSSGDGSRR